MLDHVAAHVGTDPRPDLLVAEDAVVLSLQQALALRAPDGVQALGLLLVVDPERGQEPRDAREARSHGAHAQQQVPVERVAKRLVEAAADALPQRAAPEEGL